MTLIIENTKCKKQVSIISNVKHFTIEKIDKTRWLIVYPSKEQPAYEYDTIRQTTNTFTEEMSLDLSQTKLTIQE